MIGQVQRLSSWVCILVEGRALFTNGLIGTTRNSFKGKVVTRLEYQAYSKLALKTMMSIVRETHSALAKRASTHALPNGTCWGASVSSPTHTPTPSHDPAEKPTTPPIIRIAIHHRLGSVPVGEPSIVIAVSSPHRKESFLACELVLEEVKNRVQVWKREFYEGENDAEAEWKANTS
jgi:molybdopterin synthase catalytic subunit